MVNLVIIVGRLTSDVQLQKTASGVSFARFNLACDRKKKDSNGNKQADFPSIKAFGKQAEFIGQYGHKGDVYGIIGHVNTERREKEGRYEYYEGIVADSVQFVSRAENQNSSNSTSISTEEKVKEMFGDPIEIDPTDLPF